MSICGMPKLGSGSAYRIERAVSHMQMGTRQTPQIKICGITRAEEASYLNEIHADYAGFVFWERSRRNVSFAQAEEICKFLHKDIKRVAVTVSPDLDLLERIERARFDILQVHGRLRKEVVRQCSLPIWRACNLQKPEDLQKLERLEKITGYVLDAETAGSGKAFDWSAGREMMKRMRETLFMGRKFILAGGLNAQNVTEAVKIFKPDIVDVSSGVESVREKTRALVREFSEAVRNIGEKKGERIMKKSERYYGKFGGQFVSESLMNALEELDTAYEKAIHDEEFLREYDYYMKQYVGRETPLYLAENLSREYGTKIYLKREDLNHTGAHKINNVIGQILLAKRMGKKKVIAETGAGQHGVATATGAALFHMECTVYMGEEDMRRQQLNVFRMEMLGAKVVCVKSGSRTLKDATNEAIRTWSQTVEDTFYVIGSAVGPYPYPKMVKEFQSVISRESRKQILQAEGRLPDVVMACVGGGSNSIGMFAEFIEEPSVKLIGVEAAGLGIETGKHASAMALGKPGTLHGMRSYLLQNDDGNIQVAYSVSAGLDYPGVGPEHAYLKDSGRAEYVSITDEEALAAVQELCMLEGIIPAIESAHAIAYAKKQAKKMTADEIMIVCLSGRGDKDVHTIYELNKRQ